MMNGPKVVDDDHGQIWIAVGDAYIRSWTYESDGERRQKMLMAREYVEGWCDSVKHGGKAPEPKPAQLLP